jgi:hypothetical protein
MKTLISTRKKLRWILYFVSVAVIILCSTGCIRSNNEEVVLAQPFADSVHNPATGPLRINPDNPRYFTDGAMVNGKHKAVYLTGSHTWANFQDAFATNPPPEFGYMAYLDFLQARGHNFFRLWVWEQAKGAPWADKIWFSPSAYNRTGPGKALDGQLKFNLDQFNQTYFDRMRERIVAAGQRGIYVSIMLFDGWSVGKKLSSDPGNPWPGHPFNASNNINGINGDTNQDGNGYETQNLSIPEVTALQEAYVRKVIDTVNDLDNVLYEICNECNQDSTIWQYHIIDFIHQYETTKPRQHPVGMTVEYPNGDNAELFASPADWISPNDYSDPPASDGNKIIIADTDHIWGIGGDREWVWKSFTRGIHPIFMDCYNSDYCEGGDPNVPDWVSLRLNMGYALAYAHRINLTAMVPHGDLCSTGYCLANPTGDEAEYLVYIPDGGNVDVDLSDSPAALFVEWFDPQNGNIVEAPTVSGGDAQSFSAPFSGDAVLYIYRVDSSQAVTDTPTPPSSTTTQTSTPPPAIQTQTSTPLSPTPVPPTSPLPCAQGFVALSGLFFVVVRSGSLYKKQYDRL